MDRDQQPLKKRRRHSIGGFWSAPWDRPYDASSSSRPGACHTPSTFRSVIGSTMSMATVIWGLLLPAKCAETMPTRQNRPKAHTRRTAAAASSGLLRRLINARQFDR